MKNVAIFAIIFAVSVVLAAILYIPKFRQMFGFKKIPQHKTATEKRRIAVVIPARNESRTIPALLFSIERQTYGKENFSVNVIVKDADDPTVRLAEATGASVFAVANQSRKGEALDGFFKKVISGEVAPADAYVIVDADAVLSDNYIEELNNALEYGKDVYVTEKLIKNYLYGKEKRSLACNLSATSYPVIDAMANAYRTEKDMPLQLCGQGLMITHGAIIALGGWPYRSLTEDYELKLDGYMRGFTSMYYPYAKIYTEEPVTFKEVNKRRLRWLTGFNQCDRAYGKVTRRKARNDRNKDIKFDFLFYYVSVALYLAALIATNAAAIILSLGMGGLWYIPFLSLFIAPWAFTYLMLFLYTLLVMYAYREEYRKITRRERLAVAVCAPIYWLKYVPLFVKSRTLSFGEDDGWEQVERISEEGEIYVGQT